MDVRSLTRAVAAAAVLAHAGGCITITPPAKPEPPKPPAAQPAVVPAGGPVAAQPPAAAAARGTAPTVSVSMPKLNLHAEKKVPALEMAMQWGRRVEYLPDPVQDGAMGAGLVGQLFLYGNDNPLFGVPKPTPATADGKLTVVLYHEVVGVGVPSKSVFLGQWVFEKDALKSLKCHDERWGPHYQVFLPWPTYTPDVTKIKLTAKFEPETGHTLYATAVVITIDTSVPGSGTHSATTSLPPGAQVPPGLLFNPNQPGSAPQPLPPPTPVTPAPGGIPSRAWQ